MKQNWPKNKTILNKTDKTKLKKTTKQNDKNKQNQLQNCQTQIQNEDTITVQNYIYNSIQL